MQGFISFFALILGPILGIAMVENTTEANLWYHVGFIAFLLFGVGGVLAIKDELNG